MESQLSLTAIQTELFWEEKTKELSAIGKTNRTLASDRHHHFTRDVYYWFYHGIREIC